jgi:hypothetical protein
MNTQNTKNVVDASGKPFDRQKTKREQFKDFGEHLKAFWKRFYALILTLGTILAVIISMLTCEEKVRDRVSPNESAGNQMTRPVRQVSYDPNTNRTPLYSRTKSRVDKRAEYLIEKKIEPWLLISTGKMKITRHDGSTFAPGEVVYSGSVVNVFWNRIIEPFLEEDIQEVFDEVGAECRDNDMDASIPLEEAAMLLQGMVWRIYNRMADVDQRLRTKIINEKPSRRNVQSECDRMVRFIDGQLEAAKALYSRNALGQE